MAPTSGELWGTHLMPTMLSMDFLMPNGLIISHSVSRLATLEQIKTSLWIAAKSYPLFYVLRPVTSYVFMSVTQDARHEEFHDETRRLCDLRLFWPFFKLVEPKGNREEEILNAKLNIAIGMPVNDFNDIKDLEVLTFRRSIIEQCKKTVEAREAKGDIARGLYIYPPDVHSDENEDELKDELSVLPLHIREIVSKDGGQIYITVWASQSDASRQSTVIKVPFNIKPAKVVESVMQNFAKKKMKLDIDLNSILKVRGVQDYLLGEYCLCQYRYIRVCMARSIKPALILVSHNSFYFKLPRNVMTIPSYIQRGVTALQDINSKPTTSLWTLKDKLRIRINVATYINVRDKGGRIYIKTGVYHGTELLCPNRNTAEVPASNPKWSEWLEYELDLPDIPRSARFCLSLCSVIKKQSKKFHYAIAWGNINLFDFNDRLMCDKISLHLWPMPPGVDDLLYPIGIPGSNPSTDSACIEVEFERYSAFPVVFPSAAVIDNLARVLENSSQRVSATPAEREQIDEMIHRDPLSEILEQEKELLWKLRYTCQEIPDSLPKLLQAVKWNNHDDVSVLYLMLSSWRSIRPEAALELLYCTYTDLRVREFAVNCFQDKLNDDILLQYLLQLVQVLEFEPYLDNHLTRFLLSRALNSRRIGHVFFWYIRSEMHKTSIRLRFGLILEVYCRSAVEHLHALTRQVIAIEKLTKLSDMLKMEKDDAQLQKLHNHLRKPDYLEALENFESPLCHGLILGALDVEKCDIKNSKKRPLFLSWKNQEQMSEVTFLDYNIIFKCGDDLRQDMLTLQVIGIMDAIWQREGLDLRMIPYGCLAMGLNIGMIEVVRNATTVMQILKKDIKTTKTLHSWIKDMCREDTTGIAYQEAIETFTRSCAGYCVATFILGIGDRHPSNIMVTRQGQVFHIDFGHFLDHRKKKFGINRERVPFVLTEDFINVIARGQDAPVKSVEFNRFMELCGTAYISLRKHANVFITLFTMMLSCGIPELQSIDDIGYLRKTLKVDCRSDQEALEYFQSQFNEAYDGAWTTKLDWFFHYMKHRS